MKHVDALSRVVNVMVVKENSLESNLAICQNLDVEIKAIREKLQKSEDKLFEMHNGLVYRKSNNGTLFYVPDKLINNIIRKNHDEMGHFSVEKTCDAITRNYWFSGMKERVETHIANCLKCVAFFPSTGKREGYLKPNSKGRASFLDLSHRSFWPNRSENFYEKIYFTCN